MNHVKSLVSWFAVASVVGLAILGAQACPHTDVAALSSPPIPGKAFGPTIEEFIQAAREINPGYTSVENSVDNPSW
jgi:hypothetical protein